MQDFQGSESVGNDAAGTRGHTPNATVELVQAICRALDIDPDHVTALTLNLRVGEPTVLTVEFVSVESMAWDLEGDLEPVLRRFELAPIGTSS